MHRCITGSTGAEGSSPGRLTSSLEQGMPNAPMPFVDPSVQLVPHRLASKARPSDHPTTIGCTDAYSIGSSGATEVSLS